MCVCTVTMANESSEPPVILYDTLAPLVDDTLFFDDYGFHPSAFSPSSSGHTFTDSRLQTVSQSVTEISTSSVTTTTLPSSMTTSAVGIEEGGVTVESLDGVGVTSASSTQETELIHTVDLSDQEMMEEVETDFSERVVASVQAEAPVPLKGSNEEETLDFLPLDVDGFEDGSEEAEGLLVEEAKGMLSAIKTSATQEAPPWARVGKGHGTWFRSPFLQLHQEIVDFCKFVAPTDEEKQLRADAVERVSDVINSIWPSCQVKVFGSFATGLFLPTSDCDVVILDSGCQVPQDGLKAIAKALNRKSLVKNLQVIGKARVPIVKFVETESNISFDISFDVANGPDAADFIKDAMDALPPLKPLCLVLKIFLQQRELNEVYTGGIGSYALLVMLLTHLQMHPSRRNVSSRGEPSPLESNLGILLVDFFDFYGRALNVKEVGISCRNGGRFYVKSSRGFWDSSRPYLLSVEDPQAPDNDIGKNSYNVTKVRSAFVLAHRLLTKLEVEDVPAHVGLLGRIVRMDKILINRRSLVPELPERLSSKAKVCDAGPSSGSSAKLHSGYEAYASGTSGSRWRDYEDDDFPRGGDPELDLKFSRRRKHGKEREDRGQRDGDSYKSHSHHKRKRDELDRKVDSLSGKVRRSRRGDSVDPSSPISLLPLFNEEAEQVGPTDTRVINGKVSKQKNSGRRLSNASEDATSTGRQISEGKKTADGKKNRWRRQHRQQKEDSHEEGEIVLKDDFATIGMDSEDVREEAADGAGNGHNSHKRWFNEGRSPKTGRLKTDHKDRSPDREDVGSGRSVRKVVITKAAHKKIKYI